jgi:hypothetical protein
MKWLGARASALILAAGLVLSTTGCGGPGTVYGKVTLDGKALSSGFVSMHDSEGQTRTGGILKDGTYSVSNVAPGKASVTVQTLELIDIFGKKKEADAPQAHAVLAPAKYGDPMTSGLSVEVKAGKQEFDINMKDEPKPAGS